MRMALLTELEDSVYYEMLAYTLCSLTHCLTLLLNACALSSFRHKLSPRSIIGVQVYRAFYSEAKEQAGVLGIHVCHPFDRRQPFDILHDLLSVSREPNQSLLIQIVFVATFGKYSGGL
jgi:hypothetical protein